jgi:hypothetical protein
MNQASCAIGSMKLRNNLKRRKVAYEYEKFLLLPPHILTRQTVILIALNRTIVCRDPLH